MTFNGAAKWIVLPLERDSWLFSQFLALYAKQSSPFVVSSNSLQESRNGYFLNVSFLCKFHEIALQQTL